MKRALRTGGAPAVDEALAAPLAGLACPGRQPGQGGDLASAEAAELGHAAISVLAMVLPMPGTEMRSFLLFQPKLTAADLASDLWSMTLSSF